MKRRKFPVLCFLLLVLIVFAVGYGTGRWGSLVEPSQVRTLKKQQVAQTDEGHQEYEFGLLREEEQRE